MVSSAAMLVRSKSICVTDMKPMREHDVVDVGDHRAERELPLEPEPQIDQDRDDREHQADRYRRTAARPDTRGPTTSTRR